MEMNVVKLAILSLTTLYQAIACAAEHRSSPPGQRIDVGGYRLHLWTLGTANPSTKPTIILDHSLGGIEGYFLIEDLAKISQVCIYDRAGYGWSDSSPYPRTSHHIVTELDRLLTRAGIEPPYILIGNSFGSYNVRLYAHRYPQKVLGLILTDGLHENGMLTMPLPLKALKAFFLSGFLMSIFGAFLGIIRILKLCGIFEFLKPQLRQFTEYSLWSVKGSFCRSRHWLTMLRELRNINKSSHQVREANSFNDLPIVNIKAQSFFLPSLWTLLIPLSAANRLREHMHQELSQLSTNIVHLQADKSGHFVWVDQPGIIVKAVNILFRKVNYSQN